MNFRDLCAGALLLVACGGNGNIGSTAPVPQTIPDINAFPPVPSGAPPGASAAAAATAAAIGRGVNFGNMLEGPTEGAWGLSVSDEFIDSARVAGFTAIRLPVRWSNHASADPPYTIEASFMARLERVVDKLLAEGLVVVLDMHHYRQLDGDALDQGELPVPAAAVDVRFVMLWNQIATQFRARDPRLIFELYNEPHGRLNGAPWNVLAARALGVVRKTNPDRAIIIGPTHWNSASDLRLLAMPNDANLIVTIHNYSPFSFTHQGAEWITPIMPVGVSCCSTPQVTEMTTPLDSAKAWSTATHYPVFLGEFGAYSKADSASRVTFNRTMRDAAESRGMTWAYWEFAAGFGVYDPVAHRFRTSLLASLLGR